MKKQYLNILASGIITHQFVVFYSFTFSRLDVDGDTFSWSCIEFHENRCECRIDDEGNQEEEGEEAKGAEENEERGRIK